MTRHASGASPCTAPVPPIEPALEDCCGRGCSPCVFELYEQALDRYRCALARWQAGTAAAPGGDTEPRTETGSGDRPA